MRLSTPPRHGPVALRGWLLAALLLLVAAAPASASAADRQRDDAVGRVYVLNNILTSPNSISVFARAADGALHAEGSVPIGGATRPLGAIGLTAN